MIIIIIIIVMIIIIIVLIIIIILILILILIPILILILILIIIIIIKIIIIVIIIILKQLKKNERSVSLGFFVGSGGFRARGAPLLRGFQVAKPRLCAVEVQIDNSHKEQKGSALKKSPVSCFEVWHELCHRVTFEECQVWSVPLEVGSGSWAWVGPRHE